MNARAATPGRKTRLTVAQALDAQRRSITEQLHDRAGPNLAAIAVNLRSIERRVAGLHDTDLTQLMVEAQSLLADTIAGIRDLTADLRPARLEYAGLLPALRERLERFRRASGMHTTFAVEVPQLDDPAARLPQDLELLVFRVIDEALNNCARHSSAQHVQVDLRAEGAHLMVHVRDDGVGFDPRHLGDMDTHPGMGLLALRERVEAASGVVEIFSQPAGGTHLRVDLPLGRSGG